MLRGFLFQLDEDSFVAQTALISRMTVNKRYQLILVEGVDGEKWTKESWAGLERFVSARDGRLARNAKISNIKLKLFAK